MLMSWEKNLVLNVPEMDSEHIKLIEHANNLFKAMQNGHDHDLVVKHLKFLEDYTREHFSHEEAFQIKIAYPDSENHKKIHDAFKKIVSNLIKEIQIHGLNEKKCIEINKMTMTWIRQHIAKEDKKVATYYKNL